MIQKICKYGALILEFCQILFVHYEDNLGCRGNSRILWLFKFAKNPPSDPGAKYFSSFSISGYSGNINNTALTISVEVPVGTSLTALIPVFLIGGDHIEIAGSTVTSGLTAIDFRSTVTITVFALDGSSQNYAVTVSATGTSQLHRPQALRREHRLSEVILTILRVLSGRTRGPLAPTNIIEYLQQRVYEPGVVIIKIRTLS